MQAAGKTVKGNRTKRFDFMSREIINPTRPVGVRLDETTPVADVPVVYVEGKAGGNQRSKDLVTLERAHAAQCRVLRDMERHLRGNRGVDDRMKALNVGYTDAVGRRGIEAVSALSGDTATTFDRRTAMAIAVLEGADVKEHLGTSTPLQKHFVKRVQQVRLLNRALMRLGKVTAGRNKFKDTNIRGGHAPRASTLANVFMPKFLDRGRVETWTIDEMMTIATYGLINSATLFLDYDYLKEPFALLIVIGGRAIYGRNFFASENLIVDDLRSIVCDRRVPVSVAGSAPHRQQFVDVCAHVERAWAVWRMDDELWP